LSVVQAKFQYYFEPDYSTEVPVFAGQMPLDQSVLDVVPTATMARYFISWTPTFLDVGKFAATFSAPDCAKNCTAWFLPGGVEMVRRVGPTLNVTLLADGLFNNVDSIQVRDVPGLLLRFADPEPIFEFDISQDCTIYGKRLDDPVQLCIKQMNESLVVGWQACPSALLLTKQCNKNTTWSKTQVRTKLMMTAFRQRATTSYQRANFAILNVETTSEANIQPLKMEDFTATWDKVFIASNFESAKNEDAMVSNSLTTSLTWLIRLYADVFPDDEYSPRRFLANFLSIPQQFMVTCYQFSNYTIGAFGGNTRFVVPDELATIVVGGNSSQRFSGQPWVVWLFISTSVVAVLSVIGLFLYALTQRTPMPGSAGIPNLEFLSIAGSGEDHERSATSLPDLVRSEKLDDANALQLSRSIRRRNVKLVKDMEDPGDLSIVVIDR
jgi:hypothetical protein